MPHPFPTTSGNIAAMTTAVGTTYQAFGSQACTNLLIVNDTGTDIEVIQGGGGVALPIAANAMINFTAIGNANKLSVRRKDQATTQVQVKARWEA